MLDNGPKEVSPPTGENEPGNLGNAAFPQVPGIISEPNAPTELANFTPPSDPAAPPTAFHDNVVPPTPPILERHAEPALTVPTLQHIHPEGKPQDGVTANRESRDEKSYENHIFHVEVSKVSPNPNQPRKNFNEEGIRELAYSIREFGFLQPLVVSRMEKETPAGTEVSYQLIAGERRLHAAKMLGLELVPVIIRRVDLELEKLELAVIENIQRENLNPIETARAFQRLQEEFRLTQREIAAKLGKSRETVANSVRLLDLPSYLQEALEKGQISESHGRFLLAIEDPGAQKRLFDDIVNYHLTTRDVKERVQATRSPRGATPPGSLTPEFKMIQERLSAEFGTPVSIHKKGEEAGKIEISFFSKEELQNILNKLGTEE